MVFSIKDIFDRIAAVSVTFNEKFLSESGTFVAVFFFDFANG